MILLVAAIFSIFIGHYIDLAAILLIILINSVIGFLQQYKAEKTISEMKQMLVPVVKLMRAGKLIEVSSLEIVPGDIISLSEGDRITVDCRIIHENELQADEAVLTGESFPQDKSSGALALDTILANRENMLYAGTSIVRGNALAVVVVEVAVVVPIVSAVPTSLTSTFKASLICLFSVTTGFIFNLIPYSLYSTLVPWPPLLAICVVNMGFSPPTNNSASFPL